MKKTEEFENMILDDVNNIDLVEINFQSSKEMINSLIKQQGLSISTVGTNLGMIPYIYEILDMKSLKKTKRENLLAILIFLKVDVKTTNEILQKYGYSKIYVKVKFDAIIYFCLSNKYTIDQTNEMLVNNNYPALY